MKKLGLERVPAPFAHSRDTFLRYIPVNEEARLGARAGALAQSHDTFPVIHSRDTFPWRISVTHSRE